MAMVVRVKPEYNGKISIQSNTALNETVLSNNLSQETLFSIFMNESGLREFLYTEYTTASGSYAPSQIDPSLLHAYDASEITQNPVKIDYPAGTVGKYLNETANKINSISTISTRPQSIMDFAGAKILPSYATFSRASIGSYVDVNGIIKVAKAGQPRFTHNPVTKESLGILIEESRTNYAINSNTFSINNLTSSAAKAPDGTNTALLISQIIGNPVGTFGMGLQYTSNGFYTRSIFVKPNNAVSAILIFEGIGFEGGSGANVNYNAVTKTFSGYVSSLIDYGVDTYADGWSRVWIVIEKSATKIVGANHYIQSYGGTASDTHSMMIWGYQLEIGKCPTSYIPTSGSAVTRNLDVLTIPNKYVPQIEGSVIVSGVSYRNPVGSYGIIVALSSADILGKAAAGGLNSWDGAGVALTTSMLPTDNFAAFCYNQISRKVSFNGIIQNTNSMNLTILSGGFSVGSYNGNNPAIGTIKRLTIYSRMLTDMELVKVTSATLSSNQASGLPANSDLGQLAYVDATTILSALNRQELSVDGTAASITRNIRRPYDFSFSIVDSSGVTVTSQPAVSCLANTDNALIFTAPVGKTITYAIIPYFEY